MGIIHSKPKTCSNFEYFMKPTKCKRYYRKVKNCSKRDRMLFGQNCKSQGKLFDKVFTKAKTWGELWKEIKNFSLADKINSLEKYLDRYTLGTGSIIAETIFPELAVTRMVSEAVKEIKMASHLLQLLVRLLWPYFYNMQLKTKLIFYRLVKRH